MSSRTTGGTLAAWMIIAAIVGFAGGAFAGTQSDTDNPPRTEPNSSSTTQANTPKATKTPEAAIELSAAKDQVAAHSRLDLEGKAAKEGVTLQLQRKVEDGPWEDFPIDPFSTEAGGTFSTWIQSGQTGQNKFRVVQVDDTSVKSNVVTVTIT